MPSVFFAEQGNEVIADARAEAGFQDAARNHDGHADQPDKRVGETRQRVFDRCVGLVVGHARHRHQHDGHHRQRADGHRLADNRRNHADKHRQKMPCLRRHACGHGNGKPNQQRQPHRHGGGQRFETELVHNGTPFLLGWRTRNGACGKKRDRRTIRLPCRFCNRITKKCGKTATSVRVGKDSYRKCCARQQGRLKSKKAV